MARHTTSSYIHDDAAYDAAIKRRIQANAAKGRHVRWHAEDATRSELIDWMNAQTNSAFINKMLDSYVQWGSLTVKQEVAVRKVRDIWQGLKMAREQAHDAKAAVAKHVGTVGDRTVFTLTVKRVAGYEGTFGWVSVYSMEDAEGNVVVYKGTSSDWSDVKSGDVVTVKATVKKHDEYKGLAQTLISRPIKL